MGITIREGFEAALKRQRIGRHVRARLLPDGKRWTKYLLKSVRRWQDKVAEAVRDRIEEGEPPSFTLLEEEVLNRVPVIVRYPRDWLLDVPHSEEEDEQGVAGIPLPMGPAPAPGGALRDPPADPQQWWVKFAHCPFLLKVSP